MSQIKVGDAVWGPGGIVGKITDVDLIENQVLVQGWWVSPKDCTRLVPDGLAERVRALLREAEHAGNRSVLVSEVAALLDAEPEVEPHGGMEEQPDGSVVFMEEPQPSAQVTREELARALNVVAEALADDNPMPIIMFANRLRALEKGE